MFKINKILNNRLFLNNFLDFFINFIHIRRSKNLFFLNKKNTFFYLKTRKFGFKKKNKMIKPFVFIQC